MRRARWVFLIAAIACASACRHRKHARRRAPNVAASIDPGTLDAAAHGWWVDDAGRGWWISREAIRTVDDATSTRRTVTAVRPIGATIGYATAEGLVVVRVEGARATITDATLAVRVTRANDDDVRRLEKLDVKHALSDPTACDRARRCCAGAVEKGLATQPECDGLVVVPEIGRCVRALDLLRRKAVEAHASVAACAP